MKEPDKNAEIDGPIGELPDLSDATEKSYEGQGSIHRLLELLTLWDTTPDIIELMPGEDLDEVLSSMNVEPLDLYDALTRRSSR